MNDLFLIAAHNTVVALAFAIVVYGLTRVWRNPAFAHVLWLLVLLKLVAPPVMRVDWSALLPPGSKNANVQERADVARADVARYERPTAASDPRQFRAEPETQRPLGQSQFLPEGRPTDQMTVDAPAAGVLETGLASRFGSLWEGTRPFLIWLWLGGAIFCALVAAMRILRFERILQDTLPASERLQRLAQEIAGKFKVRRMPDIRYVECVEVPLLWCAGRRPTIVLPVRLLCQFDEPHAAMILAHELAHLRRRDHWVRAVELVVSSLYWWNPLVWAIRRQLHQAEDLCCDAWVRLAFPDQEKSYAEVVLKTAELLTASRVGAPLLPASPFLRSLSLKARIEMILKSRFTPTLSPRSMVAIALVGCLVLPSFVQTTRNDARADSKADTPATPARKPETRPASEFPYAVRFEQGATKFSKGDQISIVEVRGTAATFARGNIYCVKGTYTLASRDQAILLASATVKDPDIGGLLGLQDLRVRSDFFLPGLGRDPGNATGVELDVQRADVNRGTGTFTLFFATPFGGLPHVSFCSVEKGGASFGGAYFGTGDSALKQWWNTDPIPKTPDPPAVTAYSHVLKFEQGATRYLDGDKITIQEIRGTSDTFSPSNFYQIKGTYTLASHDRATLAAYMTAREAADGRSTPSKVQSTVVNRGDGTFTLILPMTCKGWPHVSFYPADGGDSFGGNYFGTGDSVLKQWWGTAPVRSQPAK